MNWILYGFKNCGKTTLGKLLAQKYKKEFIDIDRNLEALYTEQTGKVLSAAQIFLKEGESFFRSLEQKAIILLLSVKESVISLGGGSLLQERNRAFLQKLGVLIYLNATKSLLKKRWNKNPLALFSQEKKASLSYFERTFAERKKRYLSLSKAQVNLIGQLEQDFSALCSLVESFANFPPL